MWMLTLPVGPTGMLRVSWSTVERGGLVDDWAFSRKARAAGIGRV